MALPESALPWIDLIMRVAVVIGGGGVALVKFGEWRQRVRLRSSNDDSGDDAALRRSSDRHVAAELALLESRLRGEIVSACAEARHAAKSEATSLVGQLAVRFDKAGEKTSDLATFVQALPTRDDIEALHGLTDQLYARVNEAFVSLGSNAERIARVEATLDVYIRNRS